jgi:hypothetical protein
MSSENNVADRLLADARKKTAKQEGAQLGKISLIVGVIALLASPISLAGWVLGVATIVLGGIAVRRPLTAGPAKIAIGLGVAAIFVGVFFFTLNIAQM